PNSRKHSGNKIEIKIELTYAFSNRIPVWEPGRSVLITSCKRVWYAQIQFTINNAIRQITI
ncbi:MAG: hypothetical protein DRP41_04185, partial [Thermodesulfobacteriota bacterium]